MGCKMLVLSDHTLIRNTLLAPPPPPSHHPHHPHLPHLPHHLHLLHHLPLLHLLAHLERRKAPVKGEYFVVTWHCRTVGEGKLAIVVVGLCR